MTKFVQKNGTILEINPWYSRLKVASDLENSGEQAKAEAVFDQAMFAWWKTHWVRKEKVWQS